MQQRITSNSFIRHVATLTGGAVVGQLILLLATPIVSRLYTPVAFGQFGMIMAISGIFAYVVELRLDLAVVASDNDDVALSLVVCGTASALAISALVGFGSYFFILNDIAGLGGFPAWTPFAVFLVTVTPGVWMPIRGWCIRKKAFTWLAQSQILQNFVRATGQISLGLIGFGFLGFAVSEAVAMTTIIVWIIWKWGDQLTGAVAGFRWSLAKQGLKKYRKFPLFGVPSAFIDNLGGVLPLPFITILFGIEVGGLYALSERVLHAPLSFISKGLGGAFLGHMAERLRSDQASARALLFKTLASVFAVGLGPILILFFYGEAIFAFVFGANWAFAGKISSIMAPMALVWLCVVPVSPTISAANRLDLKMIFDVTRIATLIAIFLAARLWSIPVLDFFVLYTVQGIFSYTIYLFLIVVAVHRPHV